MATKKKKDSFDEFVFWWDYDNELKTPDKWDVFDEFKTPLTYDDALKINDASAKAKRKEYFIWYFEPMQITKAEKERRVKLAECLCDEFVETMIWLYTFKESVDSDDAIARVSNNYLDAITEYLKSDFKGLSIGTLTEIAPHIEKFAKEIVDTTAKHLDEDRFFSEGRAILMAQNESAFTFNNDDFIQAISSGKTKKEWIAIIDEVTRPDHFDVDGTIIDIDEYFLVGDSLMLYPLDDEHGASMEQLCNCRCTIKYS